VSTPERPPTDEAPQPNSPTRTDGGPGETTGEGPLADGRLDADPDSTDDGRDLVDIPAVEVISRAALMLMSSAAEKLGLSSPDPETSEHRDLDEARRLITALAGLVTASAEYLGPHAGPIRDGLKSLQLAFREASPYPDQPGDGPGEKLTGPVYR